MALDSRRMWGVTLVGGGTCWEEKGEREVVHADPLNGAPKLIPSLLSLFPSPVGSHYSALSSPPPFLSSCLW